MLLHTACVLSLAVGASFSGFAVAGKPSAPPSPQLAPATERQSEVPPHRLEPAFNHIEDYQAAVEDREAEYGAYSLELSEVLFGLGQALQKEGDHEQAVDTFRHALHINRVNNGIFHIGQEPFIRAIIDSHRATDNNRGIIGLYDRLMLLYYKSYGESSPELLPLLEEAANWHRQIYLDSQSKETIGHLIWSVSLTDAAFNIANRQPAQFSQQMISLLKGSASSNWYMTRHFARYRTFTPPESASFNPKVRVKLMRQVAAGTFNTSEKARHYGFINGRDAYQRIVDILDDSDAPPQQRAEALVELGDWFTIFGRTTSARENYGKAWQLLTQSGDRTTLERLLGAPDKLPNFGLGGPGKGSLVRITMDIDTKGRPRNIEVLKTFPENDKRAATRAKKRIRKSLFRPGFKEGEPVFYEGYTFNFRLND